MLTLHSRKESSKGRQVVFSVDLENHPSVFMSITENHFNDSDRCVVIVESRTFVKLWKNEPHSIHSVASNGDIDSWKNSRKYPLATQGFSHGFDNPVPLAYIFCDKVAETSKFYLGFTNGITRTIWLLSHGAKYFPVACQLDEGAKDLASLAGVGAGNCETVKELLQNT